MGQNYSCEDCCSHVEGQRKEVVIGRELPAYSSAHQQSRRHESITSIVKDQTAYRSNRQMQKYKSGQQDQVAKKITQDEKLMDLLQKNIHYIVKLQAWVRGNKARKQFVFLKSKQIGSAKYFTMAELMETQSQVGTTPNNSTAQHEKESRPKYTFQSGATYEGEWKGPLRDGQGTQIWSDGAKYEGQWKDSKAYGTGKFTHIDGDVYHGEWQYDKANGFGVYIHSNGGQYSGNWKDDLSHGFGIETWIDNSKYMGTYNLGRKHDFGTYIWKDGSKYIGNWNENKISGIGIYEWLDGRSYQGEWIENNMEGVGIYKWLDGRSYIGEYLDDKKHGYGIFKWIDGRQYAGYWANGKQHGLGCYDKPSEGKTKFGLWEDGKVIQWFGPDMVQNINQEIQGYAQYFINPDSVDSLPPNATFQQPEYHKARIDQLEENLQKIRNLQQEYGKKIIAMEERVQKLLNQ